MLAFTPTSQGECVSGTAWAVFLGFEYPVSLPERTFDSICTSRFCNSPRLTRSAANSELMSAALPFPPARGEEGFSDTRRAILSAINRA